MSWLSRKKGIRYFLSCAFFILGSAWLLLFCILYPERNKLTVSLQSGICEDGTEVSLRILRKGSIYCTLNGGETFLYREPIVLSAEKDGSCYELEAYCVFDDGTQTPVQERFYFVIDPEVKPVATDYIVSVWGDEEELFSDESGLFVRGNQFKQYMEEHPDVDILNTIIPANYFSDREIAVRGVIMDRSGNLILSQKCGLNIYGNVSRAKNQKSFRLTARYLYDDLNEFVYPFLPQFTNKNNGEILKYKKLSFHNSGNDNGYGFIRTELCSELARQAGFPDVLAAKSATVYINNRYMGAYWLQNAFGEEYFEEKYGKYEGEMVILEGGMDHMAVSEDDTSKQRYAGEYNEFCSWLLHADVQDDAVWKRVTDTIDVENFLQYVAIEYYVNNHDWPHNNVKVYRYVSGDGGYDEVSVFDGRYRYLLYDMDYGMGLKFLGWYGRDAYTESLAGMCSVESSSALFAKMMQRKECREFFINDVLDLRNGSFRPDNTEETLQSLHGSRWAELDYMMEETEILKDSLWESDDNSITDVKNQLGGILEYAKQRPGAVVEEMRKVWNLGSPVSVVLSGDENIRICINGKEMPDSEDIVYFSDVPIEISVKANGGVHVKGYELNGRYAEGSVIQILPGEYAENQLLSVVPDYEEEACESLRLDAFRTSGSQDYVVLKNTGNVAVSLKQYYLSDDKEDIYKYQLPDEELSPGGTVTFYGGAYPVSREMKKYQTGFSWTEGESVVLSRYMEGIVEEKAADM